MAGTTLFSKVVLNILNITAYNMCICAEDTAVKCWTRIAVEEIMPKHLA